MKEFKLVIDWDKFSDGEFPTDKVKEIDADANVSIENTNSYRKKKVTISTHIEDGDDPLAIAYEMGRYIHSLLTK